MENRYPIYPSPPQPSACVSQARRREAIIIISLAEGEGSALRPAERAREA